MLTAPEFHQLAMVLPEAEWLANITNEHTRRAYNNSLYEFADFFGLTRLEEFRQVTRAHVIAFCYMKVALSRMRTLSVNNLRVLRGES